MSETSRFFFFFPICRPTSPPPAAMSRPATRWERSEWDWTVTQVLSSRLMGTECWRGRGWAGGGGAGAGAAPVG